MQKWPFWPNLSHFFVQICHCGVIFSRIGVKWFEKVGKLKKFADVTPHPRNENFWNFSKNEMLWWQKMGKVVNQVQLTIPSQSQPHLGEKLEKYAKMAIWTQSKPLFWPNLPLWVISSHIGFKWFEKVGKLKNFADVTPHQEMKIFEISPKLRCFGGKRWEKLWIRWNWPFRVISASFWGKR